MKETNYMATLVLNGFVKLCLNAMISSTIIDIRITLYRQQYHTKCLLIDSSITENETFEDLLFSKAHFLLLYIDVVFRVWSLISHEVDRISQMFCFLLSTFFGLTPLNVKTSDETILQHCSSESVISYSQF